jgi:glycosyl transferase family 2
MPISGGAIKSALPSKCSCPDMDTILLFSVIVPTRDRPERLAACLDALARVEFAPERFEVVVSDDGSTTSPTAVVARFADRLRVRLVRGSNGGPGAARNRGADRALGRFLVFTDDDCVVDQGWLAEFERRLTQAPDHLVAGRIVNGLPGNRFSTATQLIVSYVYAESDRKTTGPVLLHVQSRHSCRAVPADGRVQRSLPSGRGGGLRLLPSLAARGPSNDVRTGGGGPARSPAHLARLLPAALQLWARSLSLPPHDRGAGANLLPGPIPRSPSVITSSRSSPTPGRVRGTEVGKGYPVTSYEVTPV